jgi:hypothetical protein
MYLPKQMQAELLDNVEELERKRGMPYVNSFERRGLERGLEQGQQAMSKLVELHMTKRFGPLPTAVADRLHRASMAELQVWGEAALDAPTLEHVFASR